jgi:hypothetical protein
VNEAALFGCGKLGRVNMQKGTLAQTAKIFFDQITAILLHQFDGSFPETHFKTQASCQLVAKVSTTTLLSSVAATLVGSTWRRECLAQTVKVLFD